MKYFLLLIHFLSITIFLPSKVKESSAANIPHVSEVEGIKSRILATLTYKRNIVSIESDHRIKSIRLMQLSPRNRMNFRKTPTLMLKVVKDGNIELDEAIKEFMPKRKRKKFAVINKTFADFETLDISVYDVNDSLKFEVDLLLYIHPRK